MTEFVSKTLYGGLAKELAEIGSICQDLDKTLTTINIIRENHPVADDRKKQILVESLWSAALFAYVRCFATGKRHGLKYDIFDGLEGDPIGTHEWFKNMRDKHIAHSVNPYEECIVGVLVPVNPDDFKEPSGIQTLSVRHSTPNLDGIIQLGKLCMLLRKKLSERAKELQDKLMVELKGMEKKEIYSLKDTVFTAPGPNKAGISR